MEKIVIELPSSCPDCGENGVVCLNYSSVEDFRQDFKDACQKYIDNDRNYKFMYFIVGVEKFCLFHYTDGINIIEPEVYALEDWFNDRVVDCQEK